MRRQMDLTGHKYYCNNADELIQIALKEDIGTGDLSTDLLVPENNHWNVCCIIAKIVPFIHLQPCWQPGLYHPPTGSAQ